MKYYLRHTALLVLLASILACSNMSNVYSAAPDSGQSKRFNADQQTVNLALLATLHNTNVNIKESRNTTKGFMVLFTKAISAFSWGEVGRVLVVQEGPNNSRIFIHTLKRGKLQITGTEQSDFAKTIFAGVSEAIQEHNR